MDRYQFIAALVSSLVSLAWPVVALVIALLLRRPILQLLGRIRKGKYGDLEFDFAEEVRQLEAQLQIQGKEVDVRLPPPDPATAEQRLADAERLRAEAPNSAVLMAWLALMAEVRAAAIALPDSAEWIDQATIMDMITRLANAGALTPKSVEMIGRLQRLRDVAAHTQPGGAEVLPEGAILYMDLVRRVIAELRARRNWPARARAMAESIKKGDGRA